MGKNQFKKVATYKCNPHCFAYCILSCIKGLTNEEKQLLLAIFDYSVFSNLTFELAFLFLDEMEEYTSI